MPMRTNPPTVGSVQSPNCLLVRPTSRNTIATVNSVPPIRSKLRVRRCRLDRRQQPLDDDEGDDPDRDVDVEDPVPGQVLSEPAADERAGDERDAEHGPEQALVLTPFGGREHVADDRECDREQRTGANALDASEQDQHPHVLAEAGQRRADQEDDDADHEDRLAPVDVGQLAPERDADGAGQQVDRDRPDVVLVARELGHDGGQGRTDDRLVQGAEEQAEHHGEEDFHLRPVAQPQRGVVFQRGRIALVNVGDAFHGRSLPLLQGRLGTRDRVGRLRGRDVDRVARLWRGRWRSMQIRCADARSGGPRTGPWA